MGLDTTHDCWHGPYSAFMQWRAELAEIAGLPPLELMEGFFDLESDSNPLFIVLHGGVELLKRRIEHLCKRLPIRWEALKPSPLHILLHHSDCDGEIPWQDCKGLANAMKKLLPLVSYADSAAAKDWITSTKQFIAGLGLAAKNKENVEFH